MIEALRGLTTRGRCFIAAGAAAGLSALVLGEKDLLRVAVLLTVLPLLAAWYVGRSRYRLACTRALTPVRVPVGGRAQIRLRMQNLSRLLTGTLLLEDRLPYALGTRPRLVLERLAGHQASSVTYSVRAEVRGRYEVGPLLVRMTDPFGLCELVKSFPSLDRLTVVPEVVPLPPIRVAGEFTGTGDSRARSVAVHGEDDAATREYRHGDDLRRVHWRSTARVGELMVRREEQPWDSRATVVLDTRALAHRGDGPTASFEWAVSAAASIGSHLRHAGYRLRLVSTAFDVDANESTGDGPLLDELAQVRARSRADIAKLVDQVRSRADGGVVIGLFGLLTTAEAEVLARLRGSGLTCVAFLIDANSWVELPTEARQAADRAHKAAVGSLLSAGWRVISVPHGARLEALWPQAARRARRNRLRRSSMTDPRPSEPAAPPRRGAAVGGRHHLGIVAAAATLLASAPLIVLFESWTWLLQCALAVAAVAAAAAGARSLRAPLPLQILAMAGALLLALTWQFRSGEELFLLPTMATLEHFGVLFSEVPGVVANESLPVPDRDGLLLLTMLGVGVVAIFVDVIAVGLRRPALAGLPMLAIYSVPVAVSKESVPAIPFVIGVLGYLWLIATDNLDRVRRFGRRFTGDGRGIEAWEPSPLAAAGRRLTLLGVLIAVAVPLAVPGMTTGLVDRFGSGFRGDGTGSGGAATAVNLFAHLDGLLNRDETVELIRFTTDDPDPFYLRVGTADQISERGFDHRAPRGASVDEPIEAPVPPAGVTHHRHQAQIEVLGWEMNRLPSFAELTAVDGLDGQWRYDTEQQVLFADDRGSGGLDYEIEFVRREFDPDALAGAAPLAAQDPIQRRFATVIEQPQVAALVEELTAEADNPYEVARAIHGHFTISNGFRYSLETGSETTGSAIVDFLFEHQSGYCVQYAAAMAWMVRQAGMPARVVMGFTRGNEREAGTYLLTNHNLHAWTEVYLQGFGWVPFDPTPSSSVAGSAQREWAPDPNVPDDPTLPDDQTDNGAVPLPPGDGPDDGPAFADEPIGAVGGLPEPEGRRIWPWLLVAAGLTLVLLVAPSLRRVQLRHRRLPRRLSAGAGTGPIADPVPSGDPAAAARHWSHAAWDELVDTMIDFRVPLDPSETPRTTVERLLRECRLERGEPTPAGASARQLSEAEERARYAKLPVSPVGLGAATRTIRRALAGQAGALTRVRAVLLPSSTLLRWRSALADATGRLTLGMSRVGEALRALSPRRLMRS